MAKLKEKRLQAVLTFPEVKKIFSVVENPRDELLLKTLYYTGMRVGEIISLIPEDINFKENVIRIRAETTKTRQEALQSFPILLKPFLQEGIKYKQLGERIIPLTKQRVWQIVKYYVKKAEINKPIHPHSFRHTYGTHIWEQTHDLGKVQELLRHKSLASTGIYKHLSHKLKQKTINEVFK